KQHRSAKGFWSYIIMPLLGAAAIGVLWLNLERNSFLLGIGWAIAGLVYLVYATKGFRRQLSSIEFKETEEMSPLMKVGEK
ncbi:Putrescine importer PuuP, partial [Priestia megaterium]|nr:Putrescine importer PuuP [Priestia megaterium]